MEKIKTANTKHHSYRKNFDKYLKRKSSRTITAIMRTKRLDAGFFWLEFYPLVRDIFLERFKFYSELDFEIILQIHANQPFTLEDVRSCISRKVSYKHDIDWSKKTSLGRRSCNGLMATLQNKQHVRIFKQRGRYNKTMYEFTPKFEAIIKLVYEQILCLSLIPFNDYEKVPKGIRKSTFHMKKILKQNKYCKSLEREGGMKLKCSDSKFEILLSEARKDSK